MQCSKCGKNYDSDEPICPECHHRPGEVQVLSPADHDNFTGVTIEQDSNGNSSSQNEYSDFGPNRHVFVKRISFNHLGILGWLFLAGVIIMLAVLFLPLFLIMLASFGLSWLLSKLFRH